MRRHKVSTAEQQQVSPTIGYCILTVLYLGNGVADFSHQ